jgi:uncharacterized SAM-binding protein YcdF (DUF218 family)
MQPMKSMQKANEVDDGTTRSGPANRPARSVSAQRWVRRFGLCLLVTFCLVVVLALFRVPILIGLAKAWVVDDPAVKADAIVVLGGDPDIRPFAAARLYHEHLAPKILYMDVKLSATARLGIVIPERELTRRILMSNNIPENDLEAIGKSVASTYDEAQAVRAWAEKTGAKSIIIPTDLFHTRRVRWIFRRELRDSKIQVQVEAAHMPDYTVSDWWRHEDGLIAFETEVIKSIYYRFKY